jgi:hypothetical protein
MSKYAKVECEFQDTSLLVDALVEMGFDREKIEVHEQATNLYGYHGDKRADLANVIIRRGEVNQKLSGGMSNDIGFVRNAAGKYEAVISQYDSSYANKNWLGSLTAGYARGNMKKKAAKQGFKYTHSTQAEGKTQLHFIKA